MCFSTFLVNKDDHINTVKSNKTKQNTTSKYATLLLYAVNAIPGIRHVITVLTQIKRNTV